MTRRFYNRDAGLQSHAAMKSRTHIGIKVTLLLVPVVQMEINLSSAGRNGAMNNSYSYLSVATLEVPTKQ